METLRKLLTQTGYDKIKSKKLTDGFTYGFPIGYNGNRTNIKMKAANLKLFVGSKTELWNKVMKEVKEKRYAGPFEEVPFKNFIQSPIGLVPKDQGKKTRLIFHLSYPRDQGTSVNENTPTELTSVKYKDFDQAVRLCIAAGKGCHAGKSDLTSAFRHLCIRPEDWCLLVMKAQSPLDGKIYYFVDKCLPFGAAISCAHFQDFSDALSHITKVLTKQENINYLDDFLFAALLKRTCNNTIQKFIQICQDINFPVSMEKTVWASTEVIFLQMISIPIDKVIKAKELINQILSNKKRKTTLRRVQKLCGFLNFLGKAIVPGRAFTRRLYACTKGVLKPHHHIPVKTEMKLDLELWLTFLDHPMAYSRKFFEFDSELNAEEIEMFTDASRNAKLGCGGYNRNDWFIMQWDEDFIDNHNPSINYLELYAVTVAVFSWIHRYENKKIILFCDNLSVVHMINNSSSNCRNCMVLIRLMTLQGLIHNVQIKAKHVAGVLNRYSDLLSRMKYGQFRKLARMNKKKFNNKPAEIPEILYPMEKLWMS